MAAPPPLVVAAAVRTATMTIGERDGGGNDVDDRIVVPKNPLKSAAAVTESWMRQPQALTTPLIISFKK